MTTEPSETKVEFDLAELLKGSVESVTEKLASLSDVELTKLHALEEKGAKRVTLTDAIHREQKARSDKADTQERDSAPIAPPVVDPADGGPPTTGGSTPMFTKEQVDEMLAERDRVHAEALAKAGNAKAPEAEKVPTGKRVAFDAKAAPADAMKDGATVLFLDDAGHSLPGLSEHSFDAGAFERIGGAVRLKAPIDFLAHMKGAEIVGAALIVGGKAVGRAMLVLPFEVGNGRATRLQPGTLMFEPVASMDAAEADAP